MMLNYTPHQLRLVGEDGREVVLDPAGPAPRLTPTRTPVGSICGLPVVRTELGEPVGLPEPRAGIVLVVSALVAEHPSVAARSDLAYPGEAIRDADGRITGARGLCAGPGMADAVCCCGKPLWEAPHVRPGCAACDPDAT